MDVHEREARRLIAEGADPRRTGPAAAAHFGLPRTFTIAQGMAVGCLMGVLATVAMACVLMLALGPRVSPATGAQVDSPARAEVEAALSSVPSADRQAALADLARLVPLLHDPANLQLVRVLRTLAPEERQALAAEQRLGRLLGEIAALTEQQRTTLLAVIGEPHKVDLITRLADIADPASRSAVVYVLDQIRSGNPEVTRLLDAYWYREPALMAALAAPPPSHETRLHHAR